MFQEPHTATGHSLMYVLQTTRECVLSLKVIHWHSIDFFSVNNPIPTNLKSEAKKAAKILREFTEITNRNGPDKLIPGRPYGTELGTHPFSHWMYCLFYCCLNSFFIFVLGCLIFIFKWKWLLMSKWLEMNTCKFRDIPISRKHCIEYTQQTPSVEFASWWLQQKWEGRDLRER